jgi:hypothetical protein
MGCDGVFDRLESREAVRVAWDCGRGGEVGEAV